jgi:hypothetical protein
MLVVVVVVVVVVVAVSSVMCDHCYLIISLAKNAKKDFRDGAVAPFERFRFTQAFQPVISDSRPAYCLSP